MLTHRLSLLTGALTFAAAGTLFLSPASAQSYNDYNNGYDPSYYPGNQYNPSPTYYPGNQYANRYNPNPGYNGYTQTQPGVFSGNSALSGVVSTVVSGLLNRTLTGGSNTYPNTPYNGYYPPTGYGQGVPYNNSSAQYGYGGYYQGSPYSQPNNATNGLVTSVVSGLLNQVLRSR